MHRLPKDIHFDDENTIAPNPSCCSHGNALCDRCEEILHNVQPRARRRGKPIPLGHPSMYDMFPIVNGVNSQPDKEDEGDPVTNRRRSFALGVPTMEDMFPVVNGVRSRR